MKKHDEGYVLAYVTVVLLLFCLIAARRKLPKTNGVPA